jgi:hypothetical protein
MPMALERLTLQKLRAHHPAWRLLAADHAPFVVAFLHDAFLATNTRTISRQTLVSRLEEHLQDARSTSTLDLPRGAEAYLDEWASDGNGWLRKFYPAGTDEAHFDLTPAAERAVQWIARLLEKGFVGTQSRLLAVFELLTQIVEGSDANPDARIAELQKRRAQLDEEIARIQGGDVPLMDEAALRERFQLMATTARDLLADFRELEHSFHMLDRDVRANIATWSGGRGQLLERILGERDTIASSDQGASFRAFWDFLMSPERQEELTEKLRRVLELPAIQRMAPDPRLRRIHYDWLDAGEVTQRTVAKLSEQLRRYVDDRTFLENRRIVELIREIEQQAVALRDAPPQGTVAWVDETAPELELPFERPLFAPPFVARLTAKLLEAGDETVEADALFEQVTVDRHRLLGQVKQLLQARDRVSLAEVVAVFPLEQGLAELVTYFAIAGDDPKVVLDEGTSQHVAWTDAQSRLRAATIPLVVFCR